MTSRRWSPARTGVALLMCLPFLYPFVFLLATALKPLDEFQENKVSLPRTITFDNLTSAWRDAALGSAIWHSCLAVSVAVVITLSFCASGAYWLAIKRRRAARWIQAVLIGAMVVPAPVFVIPLFLRMSDLGLTDNLVALGFVYAAWNAPFGLYLMYTFYRSLPSEIFEAARVDGASSFQQLLRIAGPLSRPALATLGVLAFLWSWSDLLLSIVLVQDPERRTITVANALLHDRYSTNIPTEAAGILIALIPIVALFLIGQRYLARGIAAGVGK